MIEKTPVAYTLCAVYLILSQALQAKSTGGMNLKLLLCLPVKDFAKFFSA
jgi:hypothetical protein